MKKGFTIMEVLISLSLVLVITVLVATNIVGTSDKHKAEVYKSKIDWVLGEAKVYGNDILSELSSNCTSVKIGFLIEKGYVQEEKTTETGVGEIYDPRDNSSMNDIEICITYTNGKINTYLKGEN